MELTLSPLENAALLALMSRPYAVTELHTYLAARHRISRAGFYKVLKRLKDREIVVQDNRLVSVNKIWLSETQDFFKSLAEQKKTPSYLALQIARLETGDRLTYAFRSIREIDIFILNLLLDLFSLQVEKYVLIRESHEFFVLLNTSRTLRLLKEMERNKQALFLLIESTDPVDTQIVKEYVQAPAEAYRLAKRPSSVDARKVTHVIGDVIIELHLARRFTAALSALFARQTGLSQQLIARVEQLAKEKDNHKIIVYRDPEKARRLRSKFKKYFVLK